MRWRVAYYHMSTESVYARASKFFSDYKESEKLYSERRMSCTLKCGGSYIEIMIFPENQRKRNFSAERNHILIFVCDIYISPRNCSNYWEIQINGFYNMKLVSFKRSSYRIYSRGIFLSYLPLQYQWQIEDTDLVHTYR